MINQNEKRSERHTGIKLPKVENYTPIHNAPRAHRNGIDLEPLNEEIPLDID